MRNTMLIVYSAAFVLFDCIDNILTRYNLVGLRKRLAIRTIAGHLCVKANALAR